MTTRKTKNQAAWEFYEEQAAICFRPKLPNKFSLKGQSLTVEQYAEKVREVAEQAIKHSGAGLDRHDWLDCENEIGTTLFKSAVGGHKSQLIQSLEAAKERRQPLRVIIDVSDLRCACIPWELLAWESPVSRFVALDTTTPVMRIAKQLAPCWSVSEPIRLLIASASPKGSVANIDQEVSRIRQTLEPLGNRVDIRELRNTEINKLGDMLGRFDPHVLHLIAHGQPDGLELEDLASNKVLVSPQELASQINQKAVALNMFVTTACESATVMPGRMSVAHQLSLEGVPVVVAMQFELSEKATISFVENLYENLKRSDSVVMGIAKTRLSLKKSMPLSSEWASPVLYASHNQSDVLFNPIEATLVNDIWKSLEIMIEVHEHFVNFAELPEKEFVSQLLVSMLNVLQNIDQLQNISGDAFDRIVKENIIQVKRLVPLIRKDVRYIMQFISGEHRQKVSRQFFGVVEECTSNLASLIQSLRLIIRQF